MHSGVFSKYDYGPTVNQRTYGQATAPLIPLDGISKVPVGFFVGAEDQWGDPGDAAWAAGQIKSMVHYEVIPNFQHPSFMFPLNTTFLNTALTLTGQYNT